MKMLLREYIRLIVEAPVKPVEATKMGAALIRLKDELTMYDPNFYLTKVEELLDDDEIEVLDDVKFEKRIEAIFKDPMGIIGYIKLGSPSKKGECGGAWRPRYVAARKGFGPLMYDIAMAHSPNGMIPDRKHISKFARPLWKFYMDNRPDVIKEPLQPKSSGAKTTSDGCKLYNDPEHPELDVVYKATHMPGHAKMNDRHITTISKLRRLYARVGRSGPHFDVDIALGYEAGGEFFNQQFPGK